MQIYVMRHGATVWNERGITQGHTNNRLSKNGQFSVQKVSLRHKDTKFDAIYTSPLMRAVQTANIMNKHHGVKIIKDDRLTDIDQGIFTGRYYSSLTREEKEQKLARAKECGMESCQSVYNRICDFAKDLKLNNQYQIILIVTHTINSSLLEVLFTNQKVDFNKNEHIKNFVNAEVKFFDYN